jgi:hypothetical protein
MRDLGTLGVRIHLSGAEPGRTALLALGLSSTSWAGQPLPLALDPVGLPGCLLYTSVEVLTPVLVGTAGVAAGYASVEVPLPLLNPGTVTLHGQWLVPWASGGAKTSDALRWRH